MTQPTAPDKIIITQDGEKREIFMSYGLLDELATKVQDPQILAAVFIDPELREEVLKSILASRKKSGKVSAEVEDLGDIDVSTDDVERLLDWAMDHVMAFFIRALERAERMARKHEGPMKALLSSSAGSTDSASKTASAGSSESPLQD